MLVTIRSIQFICYNCKVWHPRLATLPRCSRGSTCSNSESSLQRCLLAMPPRDSLRRVVCGQVCSWLVVLLYVFTLLAVCTCSNTSSTGAAPERQPVASRNEGPDNQKLRPWPRRMTCMSEHGPQDAKSSLNSTQPRHLANASESHPKWQPPMSNNSARICEFRLLVVPEMDDQILFKANPTPYRVTIPYTLAYIGLSCEALLAMMDPCRQCGFANQMGLPGVDVTTYLNELQWVPGAGHVVTINCRVVFRPGSVPWDPRLMQGVDAVEVAIFEGGLYPYIPIPHGVVLLPADGTPENAALKRFFLQD